MSGVHTEPIRDAHAYTRTDVPWEDGGKNLLRAYGSTVEEAKIHRCRRRIWIGLGVFWAVWLVLYLT